MLSRLSGFGTAQFQKPIYLFSLTTLIVALIFNSLLLSGCTSPSPGIRKFYLVSLQYNTESTKTTVITDISKLLSSSHSKNDIVKDLAGDPLDLVTVGDLYKDKISFSTPLWASLISLAIGSFMVLVNCIPAIPIPPITRRIAAGAAGCGALMLLGCMVLQQVTTSAIATLVGHLGMKTVVIHVGSANIGFGWAAFATAMAGAIGTIAVAAAEMAIERAKAKGEEVMEKGLGKATGGRMGVQDVRNFTQPGGFAQGGLGQGAFTFPPPPTEPTELRKKLGKNGISLVGNLLTAKRGR
ncbi:Ca2+ regulator and membrane fusion protein Fig1-domain-containing protein [Trichophaea hybrida]|nr:Ca2+ regulator and membrane fusion protein Fig1-domain-containing protein [Trichophaea hybrida]